MSLKHLWRGVGLAFSAILVVAPALAGEPTEQIKATTDKILVIVSDLALKPPEKAKERKRQLRKAVDERFDWEEMSRRTLARHWAKRTEQERKEFVDLFGKLLERTYSDKVDNYSGETVRYEGDIVDGEYAEVRVRILTRKDTEIPVKYRVRKKSDGWFVYDITIEGVSLINNYRTQFNTIIMRSSYKELIKKLKAKVEED